MKRWAALFAVALAAGAAGWLAGHWLTQGDPAPEAAEAVGGGIEGSRRPVFSLPGLDGKRHDISRWDGRVILLNFWATWCAPCREEMPMLDELQAHYGNRGLQVIGVALDRPGAVQQFVERLGIDYPILVDDASGIDIARRYGNRRGVLPFSVLIRRDGVVDRVLYGKLEREELEPAVSALL